MIPKSVIIRTKYSPFYEWMAFSSWYSITKNLPDIPVVLWCYPYDKLVNYQLYLWTYKVNIKYHYSKNVNITKPSIILDPWIVMLRETEMDLEDNLEIEDSGFCSKVNSEELTPFVSVKERCANFVMTEWIDRIECPFAFADRFINYSVTFNEMRVLKLWKQLDIVFSAISRN